MESKKDTSKWYSIERPYILPVLFMIVLVMWYILYCIIRINFYNIDQAKAGQLGDSLGITNSIFSGLAFAGLFYTILLQKKELQETKLEFRQQNQTFKKQRFESIFFNLLAIHNEATRDMTYNSIQGRKVTDDIFGLLSHQFSNFDYRGVNLEDMKNKFNDHFERYLLSYNLYISSLNRLLKFVCNSDLIDDHAEKKLYYSFVEDNLTVNEKVCLYYYVSLVGDNSLHCDIRKTEKASKFLLEMNIMKFHESHEPLLQQVISREP